MRTANGKSPGGPVRCAVYVRTATVDQQAAERQRNEALAVIRQHVADGWAPLDPAYEDVGTSGLDANRPALSRLLADVQAGRIDRVVVTDVARLGRSPRLLWELAQRFGARGVTVNFAVMQGPPSSSSRQKESAA
ncbi:MAG: recombinase family protein [Deltaproteobacteria bacterium]|nr:recombinase family protein [Deltaproteobacteria bacterium]